MIRASLVFSVTRPPAPPAAPEAPAAALPVVVMSAPVPNTIVPVPAFTSIVTAPPARPPAAAVPPLLTKLLLIVTPPPLLSMSIAPPAAAAPPVVVIAPPSTVKPLAPASRFTNRPAAVMPALTSINAADKSTVPVDVTRASS